MPVKRGRSANVFQWMAHIMCYAAFLVLLAIPASANDGITPINVATLKRAVKVSDYGSYIVDIALLDSEIDEFSQRLDLSELIALAADGVFEPITTRHLAHKGAVETIIHVRIPLTNPSAEAHSFILAFNKPDFGFSAISLVVEGQPLPTAPLYKQVEDYAWDVQHGLVHQELELPAKTAAAIYVSYANFQNAIPMTVEAVEHYEDRRIIVE